MRRFLISCTRSPFYAIVPSLPVATERLRINNEIRAQELRVVGADGKNLGVLALDAALAAAKTAGLDLIEISPSAVPPVAKIMDYGKFEYERSKKEKVAKSKVKISETKEVQIKVGTGEHDMDLKAKKVAEWLAEGHRVRAELFLKGRYKGMGEEFLKERLERFLVRIPYAYKVAEPVARSPKGFAGVIERDLVAQAKRDKESKPKNENQ
jgi:translation initiation factor IF-3